MRLWITLVTGLILTGGYCAYSVVMGPATRIPLRPAAPDVQTTASTSQRPVEYVRVANAWLQDHPWTAEAKYLTRTDDEMFVYTDEWKPNGELGQIRFRPFAAVWLSKNDQGEEQAVTVCAESALLKFENPFEFDNPQPGRVTGGTLDGNVHIVGPDGLDIVGENFIFAEGTSSIFSPRSNETPVRFRFGANRGEAGELLVRLIKAETPLTKDRPNVVGIRSVELRQNVRMELKLDKDPATHPVRIRCTDSFEYRVESRTAVYHKNVEASRPDAKEPTKFDWVCCDMLTVQFDPKPKPRRGDAEEPPEAPRKNGDYQQIERDLQFRSLKAEGPKVLIGSDRQGLRAVMTQLTYDAPSRTIDMSVAGGAGTANAPQAVKVKQRRNQLQCPQIRLVLGEDNSLAEAVCLGVGWLENYDEETGELAFAADWMKQLRKSTDAETELDVIELEQDASFRQPSRETALGADLIRLWFKPPANAAADGDTFRLGGQGADADPRRLLALKNVALVSPQLEAEADQLEVLFEDRDASPASPKNALGRVERRTRGGLKLTVAKPRSASNRRQRAAFASVPPEEVALPEDSAPRPPMEVSADKIRVRMLKLENAKDQPELREIWTSGNVRVTQPPPEGDGPLTVHGDRMHVEHHSELDQVVHVFGGPGRPAHIRDERQQLHIEGQVIHFDRTENLAWVEGAGLLQLPVPKNLEGEDLAVPQILDVWWRERMDFDGLLATFEGDVRAKLAESKMECQLMQVSLSRKVSFQEPSGGKVAAEVQTITCRDGVKFENHRYQDGQLMEIQQAKVFEFHLDHATQNTEAKGPGRMEMWRRGSGKRGGLSAKESVQANRTSREPATEWEYTRVDFAGKMTGQIARRRTSFHDRVKVVYGPVLRPIDVIDRHQLPKEGAWMSCEKLEVAQTPADSSGKSCVQLLGAGNTRLEGRGFSGEADFISYDETKEQFILHSLGNHMATIWREKGPGQQEPTVRAQQLMYIPATGQTKGTQVTSGERSE